MQSKHTMHLLEKPISILLKGSINIANSPLCYTVYGLECGLEIISIMTNPMANQKLPRQMDDLD